MIPNSEANEIVLETTRFNKWMHKFKQLCKKYKVSGVHSKTAINPEDYENNLVIWVFWGDLILDIETLASVNKDFGAHNKKVFVISDCFFDQPIVLSNLCVISEPKFIALAVEPEKQIKKHNSKSKLFNCFINRVDDIRQSWFYHLHNRDLLDKGYVSFLLSQICNIDTQTLFVNNHQKSLNTLPAFQKAFEELKNVVPFKNFKDNGDLTDYVLDSKYSLVLDTYATYDNHFAVYFSEKVVRSLITPCVDLIFAQKGSYTVLEKHGFKFCKDLLQLDSLDWIQRQVALLDILQNDSITLDQNELYDHALHNKTIFTNWYNDVTDECFIENIVIKAIEQNYSSDC